MGVVTNGPNVLPVARGVLGVGLNLAGTAKYSGEAASLSTTAKQVTFDTDSQYWTTRQPVLIRFKMRSQTLTLSLGHGSAGELIAADTWSSWLPCTALYDGTDDWYVTAGAEGVLDYEIAYL